ncbi:MAG: hypothetical protein QG645_180 [Patescibacteria group bacterium]|nr:hypothetical protein [Patescibacteria group bacterium]MDQ5953554.1 hypothetical protein [Patescibacteria group bacterium]
MTKITGAKIVVIGGGTGSFTLLSGIKNYVSDVTAIVNMADDGGSTGQLRDEFGVLPPGDVRQCLVALSESPKVRELFNYRFSDGSLKGHAFGNIFLSALEQMTGSFAEAVDVADQVLNVKGKVIPVTLDNVKLVLNSRYKEVVTGQHLIGNMSFNKLDIRPDLALSPSARLNPVAKDAIKEADMIIIAPGNLYGSLAPALIVNGMKQALLATKARVVYVCNLVTKPGQSDNFCVADFADEIERFIGSKRLDFVLYNTELPSKSLLKRYALQKEFGVETKPKEFKSKHYKAVGKKLLSKEVKRAVKGDIIAHTRSYIRHDPDALARQLMKVYFS